jgi:hypothetical protein
MALTFRRIASYYRLCFVIVSLLFVLILCGIGGQLVHKYGTLIKSSETLDREGVWVIGTVTDHNYETGLFHTEDNYNLIFTYVVDGRAYQSESDVQKDYFYSVGNGTQVQVQYVPRHPAIARLEKTPDVKYARTIYPLG